MSHVHGSQTHNGVCTSNGFAEGSDKTGASAKTKWKVGAKEALLAWCRNNSKMQVQNFGKSWRDGRVFIGIINSVVPSKIHQTSPHDVRIMKYNSSLTRIIPF